MRMRIAQLVRGYRHSSEISGLVIRYLIPCFGLLWSIQFQTFQSTEARTKTHDSGPETKKRETRVEMVKERRHHIGQWNQVREDNSSTTKRDDVKFTSLRRVRPDTYVKTREW